MRFYSQAIAHASGRTYDLVRKLTPQFMRGWYRTLRPASMWRAFSTIYRRDFWTQGSGPGSTLENTAVYRAVLSRILNEHPDCQRVVDLGCGDWQFSQAMDWSSVDYVGVDVVRSVIEDNRRKYGSRAEFKCLDVVRGDLPKGDFVILKDILQHWPLKTIQDFLPRLKQYKWALITNSGYKASTLNTDCVLSGYRPLDLRQQPFHYQN